MKLIIFPISFISNKIVRIVKYSFSLHFILFPWAYISTALIVKEGSLAVPQIIQFLTFILAFLICLGYILKFWDLWIIKIILWLLSTWYMIIQSYRRLVLRLASIFIADWIWGSFSLLISRLTNLPSLHIQSFSFALLMI